VAVDHPCFMIMDDEMRPFVSNYLGHDAWLTLHDMANLRKMQGERQSQFDPSTG